jgi:tRNA pseudouridine32 synthase/23S rRNA pseudouridine746 synthase
MWHSYQTDISAIELPAQFTYPFHYTPHPLCVKAAREVMEYLARRDDWQEELQWGKMFGVLTVRNGQGEVGYLAAFSGILAGSNTHPFFVPPVYDFLQPDSFFKVEEAHISAINRQIDSLMQANDYTFARKEYDRKKQAAEEEVKALKEAMKRDKARRDTLRREQADNAELMDRLTRESQFQKAECKRKEKAWKAEVDAALTLLQSFEQPIQALKQERKQRSASLQKELFKRFRIRNAKGEETDLFALFATTPQQVPPAGAGECAAPKLLQYAYQHGMHPLAMAEFWWGKSTKAEVRRHAAFYPACQSKCAPILAFMMQGLDVEKNPLQTDEAHMAEPSIVYEDPFLMVIDKPSGLLSVPGKEESASVYGFIRRIRPEADGPLIVHRLDQATSGLMLIAKDKLTHEALQKQFLARTIKKRYIAILEKEVTPANGSIRLPLCPNPADRPRQMVDEILGKSAHTEYTVIGKEKGHTRIAFYPHTGRTHQLRVHASHAEGLQAPIRGDKLYGARDTAGRLCLHADRLEFIHPHTHEKMVIEINTPF